MKSIPWPDKRNAYAVLMILLLLISPFLEGLIKHNYFYIALLIMTVVFIVYICFNKVLYFNIPILITLVIAGIPAFFNLFSGINKEECIYGFYELVFQTTGFTLALSLFNKKTAVNKLYIKLIFMTGGTVAAVVNFFSYANHARLSGERFSFVIPYANTLSAFLLAVSFFIILEIYNSVSRKNSELSNKNSECASNTIDIKSTDNEFQQLGRLKKQAFSERLFGKKVKREFNGFLKMVLLRTGAILCMSAFVLTYSRTMWVLSLVLFIALVLYIRKAAFTFELLILSITVTACLFFYFSAGRYAGYIVPFIALCLSVFSYYAKRFLLWIFSLVSKKRLPVLIIIMVMPLTVVSLLISNLILKNQSISERLSKISLNALELMERFAYYKDSFLIARDYPVFGTGTGGWDSVQSYYQTSVYSTKLVHSSVIQALLDGGMLGLIAFLSQVAIFLVLSVKVLKTHAKKSSPVSNGSPVSDSLRFPVGLPVSDRIPMKDSLSVTFVFVNLLFILHSLLDIDMQFPYIKLLFYIGMAYLTVEYGKIGQFVLNSKKRLSIVTISSVLALTIIPQTISAVSLSLGEQYYFKGNVTKAEIYLKRASLFNPCSYNSSYLLGKMYYELFEVLKEKKYAVLSEESLKKSEICNPLSPFSYDYEAKLNVMTENTESNHLLYKKLIKLQPLQINHYIRYARHLYSELEKGVNLSYYKELAALPDKIESVRMKIAPYAYKLNNKPYIEVTPEIALYSGIAAIRLGDLNKGRRMLDIAYKYKVYRQVVNEIRKQNKLY